MILLAFIAITYGCYLANPALGWIAGGVFIFMYGYGKHKIAEEQKRQRRVDATIDRITEEILRAHAGHEEQQGRIEQKIQGGARFTRRVH